MKKDYTKLMANYKKLMDVARQTNIERDESERAAGWGVPPDGDFPSQVRTAMCAISSGMQTEDWPCIAEAQAMLEVLHVQMAGTEYRV